MKSLKIILLLFVFSTILIAQNKDYTKEPGYFDFGDLTKFEKGENITEVFLEENLIKLAAKMTNKEEPQLGSLLSNLKLIKVNVFQVDNKNEKEILSKIDEVEKSLSSKKWNRIVRSRQKGETVNVYIKPDGSENISGLVVTTMEKNGEAAFVNIVGPIDLEAISLLGDKFNVPSLNKVHKEK